jgi:hypothetical protein
VIVYLVMQISGLQVALTFGQVIRFHRIAGYTGSDICAAFLVLGTQVIQVL